VLHLLLLEMLLLLLVNHELLLLLCQVLLLTRLLTRLLLLLLLCGLGPLWCLLALIVRVTEKAHHQLSLPLKELLLLRSLLLRCQAPIPSTSCPSLSIAPLAASAGHSITPSCTVVARC
jgi:hypothetical protein